MAKRRKELGLSQERLALAAGMDRTFIGKIESGKHSPSLVSLFKLADGLQMSPEDLVREVREIELGHG